LSAAANLAALSEPEASLSPSRGDAPSR
jgi:hypothetical protein